LDDIGNAVVVTTNGKDATIYFVPKDYKNGRAIAV
jgi:hypothetical protein